MPSSSPVRGITKGPPRPTTSAAGLAGRTAIAGYVPPLSAATLPSETKARARHLLSEPGAKEFELLKKDKIFLKAAANVGVDPHSLKLDPFDAFGVTDDGMEEAVADAKRKARRTATQVAVVLASMRPLREAMHQAKERRSVWDSRVKDSLQRAVAEEQTKIELMEKRQRRLMAAIERENAHARARRAQLEQKRHEADGRMKRAMAIKAAMDAEVLASRKAKTDKVHEQLLRREQLDEAAKQMAHEKAEAERLAIEAARLRAEQQRQAHVAKLVAASLEANGAETQARLAAAVQRKQAAKYQVLQQKLERNEDNSSAIQRSLRARRAAMKAQREDAMDQASMARAADRNRRVALVLEQEELEAVAMRKLAMKEALRREREMKQKELRMKMDSWKEHTTREVLELPAPGAYTPIGGFGSPGRQGQGFSRSIKRTMMDEAERAGRELPGPPMQRPPDVLPPGGRISTGQATSSFAQAAAAASASPGPSQYSLDAGEKASTVRAAAGPGSFAFQTLREIDQVGRRKEQEQPPASVTTPNMLLELNKPKRSARQILLQAKLRACMRALVRLAAGIRRENGRAARTDRQAAQQAEAGASGSAAPEPATPGPRGNEDDLSALAARQVDGTTPSPEGGSPSAAGERQQGGDHEPAVSGPPAEGKAVSGGPGAEGASPAEAEETAKAPGALEDSSAQAPTVPSSAPPAEAASSPKEAAKAAAIISKAASEETPAEAEAAGTDAGTADPAPSSGPDLIEPATSEAAASQVDAAGASAGQPSPRDATSAPAPPAEAVAGDPNTAAEDDNQGPQAAASAEATAPADAAAPPPAPGQPPAASASAGEQQRSDDAARSNQAQSGGKAASSPADSPSAASDPDQVGAEQSSDPLTTA